MPAKIAKSTSQKLPSTKPSGHLLTNLAAKLAKPQRPTPAQKNTTHPSQIENSPKRQKGADQFLSQLRQAGGDEKASSAKASLATNASKSVEKDLTHYLLAVGATGCSKATIRNYKSDIKQFLEFLGEDNLNALGSKPKLLAFAKFQREKGLKDSSIKRKITSISQFKIWLKKEGLLKSEIPLSSAQRQSAPESDVRIIEIGRDEVATISIRQVEKSVAGDSGENANTSDSELTAKLAKFASTEDSKDNKAAVKTKQNQAERPSRQARPLGRLTLVLNLLALLIFLGGLAYFAYQQFGQAVISMAYPSVPTAASRILSFQGRLTNTAHTPIAAETEMSFALYDDPTGGNQLWSSNTCSILPDGDGIFSTNLGAGAGAGADDHDCGGSIDDDVFTENSNVWLQVTAGSGVEAEDLLPRQPIRTVAYAINAETVQGIRPSTIATHSTLLMLNQSGQLVLGTNNPEIKTATGSSLMLEANSMMIQTQAGSNGNIVFSPNGLGNVFINSDLILDGFLSAPGATFSANYSGGLALDVNGDLALSGALKDGSNANGTNGQVLTSTGTATAWTSLSGLSVGNADTLDNLDSLQFLRSDVSDSYTSGTLTFDSGTTLDINGNLSIADTDIALDGASTNLTATGNFSINSNDLFINKSTGYVGIGTTAPTGLLDVYKSATQYMSLLDNTYAQFLFNNTGNVTTPIFKIVGGGGADLINILSGSTKMFGIQNNGTTYFAGNVGIGTTSPTYTLDVNGTIRGSIARVSSRNSFGDNTYYIPELNNYLFSGNSRFNVSQTGFLSFTPTTLFNNNYDDYSNKIAAGGTGVLTIDVTKETGANGITYPQGFIYISSYHTYVPTSVAGRVMDRHGVWRNLTSATNVSNNSSYAIWRLAVPTATDLTTIELTIVAQAGTETWIDEIEYHLTRPADLAYPFVDKYTAQSLYQNTSWKDSSNITQILLSPTANSYFNTGSVGIGTTAPSQLLHVAGNMRLTGALYDGANAAGTSGQVLTTTGTATAWTALSSLSVGNADTLDNLDSLQFLRSDTSDEFSSGTLSINSAATLDVNGSLIANGSVLFQNTSDSTTAFQINRSNGINVFNVDTANGAGRVGIGTTAPGATLDVNGSIWARNGGVGTNSVWGYNNGGTISFNSTDLNIQSATDDYLSFSTRPGGTVTERLRITSAGNVGIGTTAPVAALDVRSTQSHFGANGGNAYFDNNTLNFAYTNNSNSYGWINYRGYQDGITQFRDLYIGDGKQNAVTFFQGSTGNVGIGTTSPAQKLDVSGTIQTTTGRISLDSTNNNFTLATNGANLTLENKQGNTILQTYDSITFNTIAGGSAERMRITSTGNVGIGTTAPSQSLHVAGNLRLTGALYDGANAAGTSGQVMTSTGTATAWTSLSGLSVGNADTLDNLDSLQFLRSDVSDSYTSGTLTFDSSTTLDINGNLSIADTDIALDGASTNLTATGNFSVNSDDLFIEKSTGNVGIGTTSPGAKLDVIGSLNVNDENNNWVSGTDNASYNITFPTTDLTTIGAAKFGKFGGVNNGVGFVLQQVEGTDRLIFRGSSAPGAIVWSQPEAGATLYMDLAGTRSYVFSKDSLLPYNNGDLGSDTYKWKNLYLSANGYIAGSVGIGTSSPSTRLHIEGTAGDTAADIPVKLVRNSLLTNTAVSSMIGTASTSGDMTDGFGPRYLFAIKDNAGTENFIGAFGALRDGADNSGKLIFQTYNAGSATTRMVVDKSGNVGIGTTAPSANLDIYSDTNATASVRASSSGGGYATLNLFEGGVGAYARYGVNTNRFTLGTSTGGDIIYMDRDLNTVGIGTAATSSYRLDINGSMRLSGAFYDGISAAGTSGQVLTSTGTATAWTSLSGLSVGNADTLDNLDSLQFLRSDTSDEFSSGTLSINSAATLDVNGSFIANGSVLFQNTANSTTALQVNNAAGTSVLNIDTTNGRVGVGTTAPSAKFNIEQTNGNIAMEIGQPAVGVQGSVRFYRNSLVDLANGKIIAPTYNNTEPGYIAFTSNNGLNNWRPGWLIAASTTNRAITLASDYFDVTGKSSTEAIKLRIDPTGLVGIGTTTPATLLELSNATPEVRISGTGNDSTASLRFNAQNSTARSWVFNNYGYNGAGNADNRYDLALNFDGDYSEGDFKIQRNGVDKFIIKANGYVGVGTSTPGFAFDVNGTSRFVDTLNANAGIVMGLTQKLLWGGQNVLWRPDSSGVVLTTGGTGLSIKNSAETSTHLYVRDTDGFIGINTTAPSQSLHVAGNMRLTGALYDGANVAGTSGQVLTSTGTATAWTSLSGLSVGNADTLDSLDSLQFLRSDVSDEFTSGTLSINSAATLDVNGSFVANGSALFQNTANSTTALQVNNAAGTSVLNVDTTNGRVGIGLSNPTARLQVAMADDTLTGAGFLAQNTGATELITATNDRTFAGAGNWTGSGWAVSSGVLLHTAGDTTAATLANANLTAGSIISGRTYAVTFTIGSRTAGTVTPRIGAATGSVQSVNGTYTVYITAAANNADLSFVPTTDFNGSLDNVAVSRVQNSLALLNSGRLGLGITNPSYIFDVLDNTVTNGRILNLSSSSITSGAGMFMNLGSSSVPFTGNFLDFRNSSTQRFFVNYRGGLNATYTTAVNGETANLHTLAYTNTGRNATSYYTLSTTASSGTIASATTDNTDEPMDQVYEAFKFNSGTYDNISSIRVRLKQSGTALNNGSITAYLRADNGGVPATTNLATGSQLYTRNITTSSANYDFGLSYHITANTNYWVVFVRSTTGANEIIFDGNATGTALWANSANGTAWTAQDNMTGYYYIYSRSAGALNANSFAGAGIYGGSTAGTGVTASTITGTGVSSTSSYNYGFYGNSYYGMNLNINSPNAVGIALASHNTARTGNRISDSMYNTWFTGDFISASLGNPAYNVSYQYFDGTNYTNRTVEASNSGGSSYTVLADSNDIFYFGRSSSTSSYRQLFFDLSNTPAVSGLVWEYATGEDGGGNCNAWTTATPLNDETNGMVRDGTVGLPSGTITQCRVNGTDAYWYRLSAVSVTTPISAYASNWGMFTGYFARLYGTGLEKFRIDSNGNTLTSGYIFPGSNLEGASVQSSRGILDTLYSVGTNTHFSVASGQNLGIGNIAPNYGLEVNRPVAVVADNSILASEKIANSNFSTNPDTSWTWGTGWTHDTTISEADKTPGTASYLEQPGIVAPVAGEIYRFVFTIKNYVAGTVQPCVGGVCGTAVYNNGTYTQTIIATGTGNAQLRATNTFNGSVDDVSVRQITGGNMAVAGLFTGGGTTGLKVTSAGNVGIGIAAPSQLLHVAGNMRLTGALYDGANAAGTSGQVLTSTGTATAWTSLSGLSVGNADTLDNLDSLQFLRSDVSDNYTSGTLTFDSGTELDIASGATLDVNGNLSIADTDIALDGASTNLTATGNFSVNSDDLFINKSTGNVGIGTTSPGSRLTVAGGNIELGTTYRLTNSLSDPNRTDILLYEGGTASMDFTVRHSLASFRWFDGTTERMRITPTGGLALGYTADPGVGSAIISGNVGIGTTAPGFLLDVAGDINTSTGTIRMAGTDYGQYFIDSAGTSGQLWSSDGTGRGAWVAASGVGTDDQTLAEVLASGNSAGTYSIDMNNQLITNIGNASTDFTSTGGLNLAGNLAVNTDSLYVNTATNRVGIGTTNPSAPLHVNSGANDVAGIFESTDLYTDIAIRDSSGIDAHISNYNGNLALQRITGGNVGIGIASPQAKLHINGSADDQQLIVRGNATQTANLQEWQNSAGTALSLINSTGQLGIGVTSPGAPIEVSPLTDGNGIIVAEPGDNTRDALRLSSSSTGGALAILLNGDVSVSINPTGTGVVFNETGVSTLDFRIEGDTDANLFTADAGLDMVGIGIASPSYKLDVAGDINTSTGTIRMAGTDYGQYFIDAAGTNGQVWTSDGTGRGTWAAAGAASSVAFSGITSGTNTTAAMVVGAGASLNYTSTGTINASSLAGLTSLQFLRSDASDNYTSGTLTFDSGTELDIASGATLDVNGNLSIADTDIALDGATTNFTSTGNFSVNTNQLLINKTTGDVGMGTTPSTNIDLHVYRAADASQIVAQTAESTGSWVGMLAYQANPAIHWKNGTNLRFIGSNENSAATGTEHARFDTAGKFGIGTTAPGYLLDVDGDINTSTGTIRMAGTDYGQYFINSAGTNGQLWASDGTGRGAWVAASGVGTDDQTLTEVLASGNSAGTYTIDMNAQIISNIGNAGTDFTTGGGLTLADDLTINNSSYINMPSNSWGDKWYFAGSGIKVSMDQTNTAWHWSTSGSTGLNKFRWSMSQSGGIGTLLDLEADGDAIFYGRIGIGTTAPGFLLDVAGDINTTTGTIRMAGTDYGQYFINSAGTSGQLWSSDGAGRGTWIAASGVGTDDQTLTEVLASGNSAGTYSIDMNAQIISNIGNAATDFTSTGGLNLAGAFSAASTVTLSGLAAGTDNSVLVLNTSNQVVTDEIDSRVWGTSLTDGSGTANQLAYWTDANTLGSLSYAGWDTNASDDVTAFTGLTDTPANYTGSASKIVRVNATATGLEFVDASSVSSDNYVDSVAFNTADGVFTVGRTGTLPDLTVDLDGRYLTSYSETQTLAQVLAQGNSAGAYAIDMNAQIISNIGNAGTDFTSTGGLTLAGTLDANGDVSIADTSIALDGASSNFAVTGDFSINTDDIFIQKTTGEVGIGTTAPGFLLDVAGDINSTTGTIRMAGTDYGQYFIDSAGTSGQLWSSDGTGRGAWVAASGVGTDDQTLTEVLASGNSAGTYSIDMNNQLITNIGNAGTDFTTGGGLTLAGALNVNNNVNITGYATASASLAVGYNNAPAGPGHAIFSGNVGVGTTAPGYSLDVAGDARVKDTLYLRGTSDSAIGYLSAIESNIMELQGSGFVNFKVADRTVVSVQYSDVYNYGNLHVAGTLAPTVANYDLGTTSLRWDIFANDADIDGNLSIADTSIALDGASSNFAVTGDFSINTDDIFVQKTTGEVGIGTTAPGYLLDVAGDINTTTGTIRMAGTDYGQYFINAAGTNGQVWTSDGTGRGGWAAAGTASAVAFSGITSGTNTSAAMVVGAGASLNYTSTGTINASSLAGATWAAPGAIGGTTPAAAAFTTLSASSTVTLSGLAAGTDNSVLVLNTSNQVVTDEIDSRVWGTSLTDGSGTANQLAYWTDANTLGSLSYAGWDTNASDDVTAFTGLTDTPANYTGAATRIVRVNAAGTGLEFVDATTYTADNDNYVDSVAFNTSDGVLTVGRTGSLADLTVDLDGRYLTSYSETQGLADVLAQSNSAGTYSINMNNQIISNIGNAGTDFTSTGGLNLADDLALASGADITIGGTNVSQYFITTAGTNGQIWTSDGTGAGAWAAAPTPGTSYTFSNGITEAAGAVKFGGSLTEATTIAMGNFGMIFNMTGTGDFDIQQNGTSAFLVDAATGYVGIGTTSPTAKLSVAGTTSTIANTSGDITIDAASNKISLNSDSLTDFAQASGSSGSTSKPTFSFSSDDNTGLYNPTADNLGLVVGGTEAVRLLANGNLGLGVSNPSEKLVVNGSAIIEKLYDLTNTAYFLDPAAVGTALKVAGDVVVGGDILPDTDNTLSLGSAAYRFNELYLGPDSLKIVNTYTDASNYEYGNLSFASNVLTLGTTAAGTGSVRGIQLKAGSTTGLYMDGSTARVGIGTTAPSHQLHLEGSSTGFLMRLNNIASGGDGIIVRTGDSTPDNTTYYMVFQDGDGSTDGNVRATGAGGVEFNTTSDRRLKTNLQVYDNALSTIANINPYYYEMIQAPGQTEVGVMAQDLYEYYPYAVSGTPESDYRINPMMVDYSKLTPLLLGGIKEQQSLIVTLQTQVNDLLGQLNALSTGLANSLNTNLLTARRVVADQIQVGGQALDQYIKTVVQTAFNNNELTAPAAQETSSDQPTMLGELLFETEEGDLMADSNLIVNQDLEVKGDLTATGSSKLGQLIASSVTTDNFEANNAQIAEADITNANIQNASISGELYANSIDANIINGLQERLEAAVANQLADATLMASIFGDTTATNEDYLNQVADEMGVDLTASSATNSAELINGSDLTLSGTLMANSAYIDGYFEVNGSAMVKEALAVGQTLMVGSGLTMGDGYIAFASETSHDLAIQPAGKGRLSLMANLMTLDEGGLVTINGDLRVAGALEVSEELRVKDTLLTNLIKAENPDQGIKVQLAQTVQAAEGEVVKETNFEFVDENGTPVATMSASGDLALAGNLKVEQSPATATESATLNAKAAGQATILAGQTSVTIKTSRLTENSMIYITPLTSTNNQVIYVQSKLLDSSFTAENEAEFTVGFDFALDKDVQFNWWIVN